MGKIKTGFGILPELDTLDFAILNYLQVDGRTSFTDISEKEGVSVGTVRTRFSRLLQEGVLSIIGRVDPTKVGFNSYAHIAVSIRPAKFREKIAVLISKMREVSFVASTSGEYDLEVDVMCTNNEHLTEFVDRLSSMEGVSHTNTTIYLKVYKYAQPELVALGKH